MRGLRLFAPANGDVEEVCRDRRGAPSDDCIEELFVQIVALLALDLVRVIRVRVRVRVRARVRVRVRVRVIRP